jgi:tRNA (guanine-N7-)-methyltransferase
MVRTIEKLEKEELNNIKLICIDAKELVNIFDKEIDLIYLNFSDPWPKKRHAKRRLTSNMFLNIYDKLFKDTCVIEQKTDNVLLFEYSLIQYSQYGYKIENISLDLHNRLDIDNSFTEYEKKFSSQGIKINYVKVVKK